MYSSIPAAVYNIPYNIIFLTYWEAEASHASVSLPRPVTTYWWRCDGNTGPPPVRTPTDFSNCLRIRWELAKAQRSFTDISVRAEHKIQNIFSIKKCCNLKNYVNKMKPIIFNQFGNCCNFSWEHWSILIIWWLVRSRKLVCDLDQSSRRHVKTGYFREDGRRFLEITAVHVASVKVRHLPVNPGHLSASTGMEREENWKLKKKYLFFTC